MTYLWSGWTTATVCHLEVKEGRYFIFAYITYSAVKNYMRPLEFLF